MKKCEAVPDRSWSWRRPVSPAVSRKDPEPGDVAGYDEGEEYLSIWVPLHRGYRGGTGLQGVCGQLLMRPTTESISRTLSSCRRNDSGGGYSDKVNASVMVRRTAGCAYSRRRRISRHTRPTESSSRWQT